mgnify:CR=1 FL=1
MKIFEVALLTDDFCISSTNCLFFMYLLPVSSRMFSRSSISSISSVTSGFIGVELQVLSSPFWICFFVDFGCYCYALSKAFSSYFLFLDCYLQSLRMYWSFLSLSTTSSTDFRDLIDSSSTSFFDLFWNRAYF